MKPVVVRYKDRKVRLYFRGDAAFASPEIYEYLEAEGFLYAIRLPKNQILQESTGHLLTRPVGRPPKHVLRFYASFLRTLALPKEVVAMSRSNWRRLPCRRSCSGIS